MKSFLTEEEFLLRYPTQTPYVIVGEKVGSWTVVESPKYSVQGSTVYVYFRWADEEKQQFGSSIHHYKVKRNAADIS